MSSQQSPARCLHDVSAFAGKEELPRDPALATQASRALQPLLASDVWREIYHRLLTSRLQTAHPTPRQFEPSLPTRRPSPAHTPSHRPQTHRSHVPLRRPPIHGRRRPNCLDAPHVDRREKDSPCRCRSQNLPRCCAPGCRLASGTVLLGRRWAREEGRVRAHQAAALWL